MLVNLMGMSIIMFGVAVVAIVSKQSFRRLNRPEDQMLLTENLAD